MSGTGSPNASAKGPAQAPALLITKRALISVSRPARQMKAVGRLLDMGHGRVFENIHAGPPRRMGEGRGDKARIGMSITCAQRRAHDVSRNPGKTLPQLVSADQLQVEPQIAATRAA